MGAVVTSQLVDVIDVFSARRLHQSGSTQQLDECQVEPWGLSLRCPTPADPVYDGEITWLLLEDGLRLTRYQSRRRHAQRGPSLITAVCIDRDTRSWTTTDLLLGLEIPDCGAPRVIQSEDFAAAISRGLIRLSEADYALRTMHRTLEELILHRDVGQWLADRGIFDSW
jgi:predicted RNA-binding protein associated with RNAse of E/G family